MPIAEAKKQVWAIIQELSGKQGRKYQDGYLQPPIAWPSLQNTLPGRPIANMILIKGLWLFGPVGVGKTFLIEVFETFTKRAMLPTAFTRSTTSKRSAGTCQGVGYGELYKYYQGFICYDDVGIENKVQYMG